MELATGMSEKGVYNKKANKKRLFELKFRLFRKTWKYSKLKPRPNANYLTIKIITF